MSDDKSDRLEQATPRQHHESTAASRDRAYHILRDHHPNMDRDQARKISNEAVEKAKRSRDP